MDVGQVQVDWTHWILLSAVFLAAYDLAKKASVRNNAVLPVLLISTFAGAAAFMFALALSGRLPVVIASIDARVIVLAALKSVIVATSWVFTFTALKTLPITIATPIRASSPALVFLAALCLYGEVPTVVQGLGMLAVFAGYFVFSWAGRHEGIDFLRCRAVHCAIAGAIFSAVSSLWDKYVFQVAAAPVEATQLLFQLGLIVVYGLLFALNRLAKSPSTPFTFRMTIPFVGILLAAADWFYFKGVAVPDMPISVGALLRRFSVALTFVFGAFCFRETNLRRKTLALLIILLGVFLLTK